MPGISFIYQNEIFPDNVMVVHSVAENATENNLTQNSIMYSLYGQLV